MEYIIEYKIDLKLILGYASLLLGTLSIQVHPRRIAGFEVQALINLSSKLGHSFLNILEIIKYLMNYIKKSFIS